MWYCGRVITSGENALVINLDGILPQTFHVGG